MTVDVPICFECQWYRKPPLRATRELTCDAFPDGIAKEVLETGQHKKVLKGQEGKFTFKKVE